MTLREQQSLFVKLTGQLIEWAYANGYELTFSQAFRTRDEALKNAMEGCGIKNSLHCLRLAIDFNAFKNNNYLMSVEEYRPIGEQWMKMHPLCRWGGLFNRPDADHFSMTWEGVS